MHTPQSHEHSPLIHPTVLSPDVDSIVVESTLIVVSDLRALGFTIDEAAQDAAEFLADQVASFGGYERSAS